MYTDRVRAFEIQGFEIYKKDGYIYAQKGTYTIKLCEFFRKIYLKIRKRGNIMDFPYKKGEITVLACDVIPFTFLSFLR